MNTNVSKFLNKQNIKLLWDVLLDELRIDPTNKTVLSNIRTVFESNINPFTKNTSVNSNVQLVNLNKQCGAGSKTYFPHYLNCLPPKALHFLSYCFKLFLGPTWQT